MVLGYLLTRANPHFSVFDCVSETIRERQSQWCVWQPLLMLSRHLTTQGGKKKKLATALEQSTQKRFSIASDPQVNLGEVCSSATAFLIACLGKTWTDRKSMRPQNAEEENRSWRINQVVHPQLPATKAAPVKFERGYNKIAKLAAGEKDKMWKINVKMANKPRVQHTYT